MAKRKGSKTGKNGREVIEVPNSYFEQITMIQQTPQGPQRVGTPAWAAIVQGYFPGKTGYWIGRAIDKVQQRSGEYAKRRQEMLEAQAKRHSKDVKGPDPNHKGEGVFDLPGPVGGVERFTALALVRWAQTTQDVAYRVGREMQSLTAQVERQASAAVPGLLPRCHHTRCN